MIIGSDREMGNFLDKDIDRENLPKIFGQNIAIAAI